MTSLNLISLVYEIRKFVMGILYWKQGLLCDKKESLENLVGKRSCSKPTFLRFPQFFFLWMEKLWVIRNFNCRLQMFSNFTGLKICGLVRDKRFYFFLLHIHRKIFNPYHAMSHFDALKIYSCGKHCEKRRNCL